MLNLPTQGHPINYTWQSLKFWIILDSFIKNSLINFLSSLSSMPSSGDMLGSGKSFVEICEYDIHMIVKSKIFFIAQIF